MASRTISIPGSLLPGVALAIQHAQHLGSLKAVIENLPVATRSIRNITRAVAEKFGISLADARRLLVPLLSFHQLRDRYGMSAGEAFDAITNSLETDAPEEWRAKNFDAWKGARAQIEEVTSGNHPLYFVQKNLRLKYEHANVLRDASIVVDARPVFDEAGRDISQWAIDYVLQVEYYDGDTVRHLYATLDIKDIEKLTAQCARAEAKTKALRSALELSKRPVIVTGEDEE